MEGQMGPLLALGSSPWNKEALQCHLVKGGGLRVFSQVATPVSPWATQPAHPPACWATCCGIQQFHCCLTQKSCALL